MGIENAGFDRTRLERIGPAMKGLVSDQALSGMVTLIQRRGETVHHHACGLMDRERQRDMRKDAIFRIYSMTKPITCVALMMLYEEGRFRLQDPVRKFIGAFAGLKVHSGGADGALEPLERDVTIGDLLTHTSGMTYHFREGGAVEALYREAEVFSDQPLEQLVEDLARLPLAFQPGSEWRYSVSQDVAAHLVQVLADTDFDDFLQTRLFATLGMSDTGFYVPAADHHRFCAMYGAGNITRPDATSSSLDSAAESGVNELLADPASCLESAPHRVLRGGHGLVSTAADYLRFCRLLLDGGTFDGERLLSRKTLELMTCNHLPASLLPMAYEDETIPGCGYGLGFGVTMDLGLAQSPGSVGEYFWSGAASTAFWVDPSEQLIGIQMAQFQPSGFHPAGDLFKIMTYQAIAD